MHQLSVRTFQIKDEHKGGKHYYRFHQLNRQPQPTICHGTQYFPRTQLLPVHQAQSFVSFKRSSANLIAVTEQR